MNFRCGSWRFVASFIFNILSMLRNSLFSVQFLKNVSVFLILSFADSAVFAQQVVMSFVHMSEKSFSLEYHSSTNSWSKFLIVGANPSFKPFGISFSAMQRVKESLCDSYFFILSLRRLSFNAIGSLFLLLADVCCKEGAIWFVTSLTSVHVEACSTKVIGVCSLRFLFQVLLLISSLSLDLLLKKIGDWQ